jgi:ADP-ribose pyrophosphatase YjhB (NUDIX family)
MVGRNMAIEESIFEIADELRSIRSAGLIFNEDPYDRERYERILALSARMTSLVVDDSPEELLGHFQNTLLHLSPLVGASTVVQMDGKILLIQRTDNGLWAVPGGLVEVGEVLAEAALRELAKEAGISGRVVDLLAIFDSRLWKTYTTSHLLHFVFLGETDDPSPKPGLEALDAGFFSIDELPPLAPGQLRRFPVILKILAGDIPKPYFDSRYGFEGLHEQDAV